MACADSGASEGGGGGSGYIDGLTNPSTVAGDETDGMPDPADPTGVTKMTGRIGDGYARITW
jgi:hypothetical protein